MAFVYVLFRSVYAIHIPGVIKQNLLIGVEEFDKKSLLTLLFEYVYISVSKTFEGSKKL